VDARRESEKAARLAPGVLDETERGRAAGFLRSTDRRCYVAAHVALRVLLGAQLGTAAGAVRLLREPCPSCGGPHGRPAVEGGGAYFSLSHSGESALIAIAAVPVGIDVERIPGPGVVAEVSTALHPLEQAELAALPEQARPLAFARAWSRKEAYLKGIGTGLGRDPALDYVGTGLSPAPGPGDWVLTDVVAPPGYAAAVAVQV
jgi:4'-phosphopantetheinyl transferase